LQSYHPAHLLLPRLRCRGGPSPGDARARTHRWPHRAERQRSRERHRISVGSNTALLERAHP